MAEMPTSRDLKSEDFFSDQHPPPPDRIRQCDHPLENFFLDLDPLPPLSPTDRFRGKNLDLSVRDFSWLNIHPIRLAYIGVTKKKLSSFCCNEQRASRKKMRPETVIQA